MPSNTPGPPWTIISLLILVILVIVVGIIVLLAYSVNGAFPKTVSSPSGTTGTTTGSSVMEYSQFISTRDNNIQQRQFQVQSQAPKDEKIYFTHEFRILQAKFSTGGVVELSVAFNQSRTCYIQLLDAEEEEEEKDNILWRSEKLVMDIQKAKVLHFALETSIKKSSSGRLKILLKDAFSDEILASEFITIADKPPLVAKKPSAIQSRFSNRDNRVIQLLLDSPSSKSSSFASRWRIPPEEKYS